MARWYEASVEAAFKAVPEGYVYASPHPMLFARPRYYLVNEAQKAEIVGYMRKRVLISLTMIPVLLVAMIALMVYLQIGLKVPMFISAVAGTVLMLIPLLAIPQIYFMRAAGSLLARLPRTEQRISTREQVAKVSATAPKWLMLVGAGAGILMTVGGVMILMDTTSSKSIFSYSSLVTGPLIAAYFIWLLRLKMKASRT